MPTYQRRPSSGNTPALLVVGAFVLMACAVGAAVYFANKSSGAKDNKDAPGEPRAKAEPVPKPQPKSAPKTKDGKDGKDEREWRAAVEAEVEEARGRKRPAEPVKGATMTEAEYRVAVENIPAFRRIFTIDEPQLYNQSIVSAAIDMPFPAGAVLPETCRVIRREAFVQYATRPENELNLVVPAVPVLRPLLDESFRKRMRARLPSAERKALHAKFAAITGDKEAWSLLHPFDELDGAEMKAAVAAAERVRDSGLKSVTPEDRRLLLRAGALDFVAQAR